MSTAELLVRVGDHEVGRLKRDDGGQCVLRYADSWRTASGAFPLSLSMPLSAAEHGPEVVDPYLRGLLADDELTLRRWAKRFQVSARSSFELLAHVGRDCAGAAQYLLAGSPPDNGEVLVIDESEVAARLRELREDPSMGRRADDESLFSLAGSQPKTALLFDGKRWGLPRGRTPTTHILKPSQATRDGHAHNEHFCLALAREVGIAAAESQLMRFEDQLALVVTRYDRRWRGDAVIRVHQEDACQALGVHPWRKTQSEGGPSPEQIIELLRAHSRRPAEDIDTFIDALAFNWLIAGPDAHAKNYSLLIGAEGQIRLAPLYDVSSLLPSADYSVHNTRLAMKIGGSSRIRDIQKPQWSQLAANLGIDEPRMLGRIHTMATALPEEAQSLLDHIRAQGLHHPILPKLAEEISKRALKCTQALE